MPIQVSASLLSANFSALADEVCALEEAGADRVHFDIMDGHFVPNITFGPGLLKDLRPHSSLLFEAHLMIEHVDHYLKACADGGADIILIHPESSADLHRSLQTIKSLEKKSGIVLNPLTSTEVLASVLDHIDQILIMTVNPGFAGQQFMPEQLPKISKVHEIVQGRPIDIAVDGGITITNAPQVVESGATVLVAGTAIFQDRHLETNIAALRGDFSPEQRPQIP